MTTVTFDFAKRLDQTAEDTEALLGQGKFTFIGLPMKWRDGTSSPIRAVAVFDLS